jgi:hypothetical protein
MRSLKIAALLHLWWSCCSIICRVGRREFDDSATTTANLWAADGVDRVDDGRPEVVPMTIVMKWSAWTMQQLATTTPVPVFGQ